VTVGSTIKLEGEQTRHVLHSHEVSYGYGRGSGQQSVTGFPEKDSANSLWVVRSAKVRPVVRWRARPAACMVLRMWAVGYWLSGSSSAEPRQVHCRCQHQPHYVRTLLHPSLHGQQGSQGSPIKNGQAVKLQHIATRRWLHSHMFASPLSNNQEVRGRGGSTSARAAGVQHASGAGKGAGCTAPW